MCKNCYWYEYEDTFNGPHGYCSWLPSDDKLPYWLTQAIADYHTEQRSSLEGRGCPCFEARYPCEG